MRRASKRGVAVKAAEFSTTFVEVSNRSTTKYQVGPKFGTTADPKRWMENATCLGAASSSAFFGQTIGCRLITWTIGGCQILSMSCLDSGPNALLKPWVCSQESFFVYGNTLRGNPNTTLAEFKRRNGFEQMNFPRYYVPLTLKGRLALMLKLHRSLTQLLPPELAAFLIKVRAKLSSTATQKPAGKPPTTALMNKQAETT